jgi:hypothetical protein
MKIKIIIFLSVIAYFSLTGRDVYSQCSDAGICVFGKKRDEGAKSFNSQFSLSYVFGRSGKSTDADDDIIYNSVKIAGEFEVFNQLRFGFNMPYSFNSGNLGSASGIGDLTLYGTYTIPVNKHTLSFQLGGKLATGKINTNDSLPQAYMPGLGTNDLLIGVGYSTSNFSISAAYQKPFGRSANYITRLKRGDDFLFRAGYHEVFNKLKIKAEVLTILRIQQSSIQDPIAFNEYFTDIDGSNETQVNLLGEVTYSVSKNFELTGMAAVPLLKRDYNLDGLRRSISLSAGVTYMFSFE